MIPNSFDRPLENKQVLLLMPKFFELQIKIRTGLEKLGAKVILVESLIFFQDKRINNNSLDRWLRILKDPFYRQRHTAKILKEIESCDIDILLTVFNYSASPELISHLKRKNPDFKSYIYFWDTFSTWNFRYQMDYFDYKYSFDKKDCQNCNSQKLEYLPLFWTEDQVTNEKKYVFDLTHIGSLHPLYATRLSSVIELYEKCNALGMKTFIALVGIYADKRKLNSSFKKIVHYYVNKEFREYVDKVQDAVKKYNNLIRSTPLPLEEVHTVEKHSRCIVDVNMDRAGIAIRVIAALANGQKVMTNNPYIKEEPFYNPQNIYVIDEKNIAIDKDWLFSQNVEVNMDFLRLDNWLKRILRIEQYTN